MKENKTFKLTARVSSASPNSIESMLRKFVASGSVRKDEKSGDFIVEAEVEGTSAKELNRSLLSELRRIEKKTRLRAEWTSGNVTERYFDYVLKKKVS